MSYLSTLPLLLLLNAPGPGDQAPAKMTKTWSATCPIGTRKVESGWWRARRR